MLCVKYARLFTVYISFCNETLQLERLLLYFNLILTYPVNVQNGVTHLVLRVWIMCETAMLSRALHILQGRRSFPPLQSMCDEKRPKCVECCDTGKKSNE